RAIPAGFMRSLTISCLKGLPPTQLVHRFLQDVVAQRAPPRLLLRRAACTDRMMPVRHGPSYRPTMRYGDEDGTSKKLQSIPRTPTSFMYPTSQCPVRKMAERAGWWCADRPAE